MTLTVSSPERFTAIAPDRFTAVRLDGVWTVWDAERELFVAHQAVWHEAAALVVSESLRHRPGYVHLWTWSAEPPEVS